MDLINNRYRILKNIKQNRLQSSYLALDMKRGHAAVQLNIINSEYFPEVLLNFYNTEFKTLTTIQDSNIIRLYDFGLIQLIDNKKMDNNQYYYTNENIEESVSLMQLISNMNEEDNLNLFIDICKSINYLH
jgi:serine/threonine protein kinase